MSSMKYDSVACDTVVKALEEVSQILADVDNDVQRFINGIPSNSRIDTAIKNKSYKTRYFEDGTSETYLDEGTRSYYINKYKVPIQTASSNLSTIITNVEGLKSDLDDTDSRIHQIQELVTEYEGTKIDPDTTGLMEKSNEVEKIIERERPKEETAKEGPGTVKLNVDTDNDGKPDLNIDVDGDGKADLNIDTDNDGKPDINIDTDGDGKADLNIDVDNDGKPDYNVDKSGDGKADLNVDTNNDGKPDLNLDLDGDGKADLNIDTNNDGAPDINVDIDGDGKADLNIDTNGDGKADKNIDADGDGVVDPVVPNNGGGDTSKPEDGDGTAETKEPDESSSDLFKDDKADETEDGFADNIIAGVTPDGGTGTNAEDGPGSTSSTGGANGTGTGSTGSIWGPGTSGGSGSGSTDESGGLFPFLPGGSTSSDGENPDFIYRGLYDQSSDGNFDMNQIKYNAIGEDGSSISKGAAVVGAVGLGASGVDAVATLNENRKQEGDTTTSTEDKEEKKLIKTIVSSSVLGLVSIGYVIAALMPNSSIFAIILLGVAMAISSITATSGLKIGKYIGFGAVLFVSLLTFVLSSIGIISPIAYVVVFATFVILSIAAFLLDLLKGMFDDKIELVPIIIAIAVGLFCGMLKVLDIINWIVLVILLVLTVGGYFLWDKVIKYKLPDDDDDEEVVDNVIYKPVQYTENSPMNTPEEEKFDPRSLYKEDDENVKPALGDRTKQENQNPFANYNPHNSTFENAFKNDDNNNNNGMF